MPPWEDKEEEKVQKQSSQKQGKLQNYTANKKLIWKPQKYFFYRQNDSAGAQFDNTLRVKDPITL